VPTKKPKQKFIHKVKALRLFPDPDGYFKPVVCTFLSEPSEGHKKAKEAFKASYLGFTWVKIISVSPQA
jgi:hypothetical protein